MLTLTFVLWRKMIWENKVNTERNRKNDRQINQLIHLCGPYSWTIWANTFLIQYKVTPQTCYLKSQESWLMTTHRKVLPHLTSAHFYFFCSLNSMLWTLNSSQTKLLCIPGNCPSLSTCLYPLCLPVPYLSSDLS